MECTLPPSGVTTNNTDMTTDSDSGMTQKGDLVVVGSSAGGIGALSTLVSTLNKNFPAPIVLAQHLDPQRPSHLGTILERRSTLPIVVVLSLIHISEPTRLLSISYA